MSDDNESSPREKIHVSRRGSVDIEIDSTPKNTTSRTTLPRTFFVSLYIFFFSSLTHQNSSEYSLSFQHFFKRRRARRFGDGGVNGES